MNQNLKKIQDLLQKKTDLTEQDKETLIKAIADADKQWAITEFKLERTEKVKRTTAILLEETIEELENKRKAIEAQNRELEIESSLERVRTVAMSMNKPDDMLHVCSTITEQLQHLNVKEIRNVQTAIFYKERGTYMNYEYYAKHNKTFITETKYTDHEIHQDFADKMLKGNREFMVAHIKGDEVKAWVDYQKTTNVFIDDYLYTASSLNYYWFSLGPVALGISTYVPLTDEETNLFRRFLKVFELSYRRYLDIEKAEAQAYEAKVEASLEKVRAVAMSMNKADDLLNICETLFKEFSAFGFSDLRNAMINIHNDENKTFVNYDYSDEIGKSTNHLVYDIHPVIQKQMMQIRTANDAFSETVFAGKDLEDWKKFRKEIGEKDDPRINDATALYYYFYSIGTGSIGISTFSAVDQEKIKLLKRFRNVFNLSYQRYTDLALAEVQAKEARIEAALERVRAQAMSIRKSEELAVIGEIIFEQLKLLGFSDLRNSEIIINNDAKESILSYYYSDYGITGNIEVYYKTNPTVQHWVNELKKANDAFAAIEISENEMDAWRKYREEIGYQPDPKLNDAKSVFYYSYSTGLGALSISSFTKISDEQIKTLERFRNVFGLAYRRYADVAQAEAQAREAQIELALERVRARTMAMQRSDELAETVFILFQQFKQLGENPDQATIGIINEDERVIEYWVTMYGNQTNRVYKFSIDEPNVTNKIYHAWKEQKSSLVIELNGKELYDFATFRERMGGAAYNPEEKRRVINVAFFSKGIINVQSSESRSAESIRLLERFAGVFEQTYTRFLDLQKAEAQAKESQIQLALERARTQSMIMQHSNELADTLRVFHEQVLSLGIQSAFSFLWLPDEENDRHIFWAAWAENNSTVFKSKATNYPLDRNEPATAQCLIDWRGTEPVVSYHVSPAGVESYFAAWQELIAGVDQLKPEYFSNGLYYVEAFMKYGCFGVMASVDLTNDEKKILDRFAVEFERAYTRFLDLQKAEEQAREAQIEAALERVRSRSMGMQKSEELKDVIRVVYEQFVQLNIKIEHAGFVMDYKSRNDYDIWIADPLGVPSRVIVPYFDSVYYNRFNEAKEKGEDFFATNLSFEEKNKFYKKLFQYVPGLTEQAKKFYFNCPGLAASTVLLENVCLYIENFSGIPYTEEENKTLMRFGKVFQQTYTRFLDLQKAETQAKEAQIEASLERVRSKAMAMHNSTDLTEAAGALFTELNKLGINPIRSGFVLLTDKSRNAKLYPAASFDKENTISLTGEFEFVGHTVFEKQYESWQKKENYFPVLEGEALRSYYKILADGLSVSYESFPTNKKQFGNFLPFTEGFLFTWSDEPYSEKEISILDRFKTILDLTIRRYLDLQKAEAQARESQIEVALERVRSRTLAMQKSDELAETAAVLFRQLILLGIEPNRLYITIIKDGQGEADFWITDEDGSKVSSSFETNLNNNTTFKKMFEGWNEKKKSLIIDMHGRELQEYFQYLTSIKVPFKGGLTQTRRIQHIAYFNNGFIGMASPDDQLEETLQLLERFAYVFNLTYTRFNDLQVAEIHALKAEQDLIEIKAARKKAEETLAELQTTQKQLIQSEKMASLGELTAGIAHEIQNPLNFVNNFSEVNAELIEEMKEEIEKGNMEEVKAIANDIRENEQKINHHGKRADAIVKGMLQHSRSSSSVKEPTDINKLADEYLRLAYHGLRAKDKSFNATMQTDYDDTIGNMNIIPQDIGRVLLNLLTNAFYAVTEKKKSAGKNYEPTVTISTKKSGNQVSIGVRDNGNGIPQKVVDKIFQPFFTTKPTGQGTGLGLSLSYDIIKSHHGEMKVETKENEFARFVITLPLEISI